MECYVFFAAELSSHSQVSNAFRKVKEIYQHSGYETAWVDNKNGTGKDGLSSLPNLQGRSIYVFPTFTSLIKYRLGRIYFSRKSAECCFWVQGAVPEESFKRHGSYIRLLVLKSLELLAFFLADRFIFVSPKMKEHFSKYTKNKKSVVIPCVSSLVHRADLVRRPGSYCYIGGMSKWQRFEDICGYMCSVLSRSNSTHFYVATRQKDIALMCVTKANLPRCRVTILTLDNEEDIAAFLSTMEFGFLVRDDTIVNKVSSPIKLAEYLSCGVNVIISKGVASYFEKVVNIGAGFDFDKGPQQRMGSDERAAFRLFESEFSVLSQIRRLQANG